MKFNTCFTTVIFDQNIPYFNDFLQSLENQSYLDFTLLLFNDGVNDLRKHLQNYSGHYIIVELNITNSIAENRSELLKYLKESHFTYCVFGDSDDFFPKNRVKVNIDYLNAHDIVINDLFLVNENGEPLSENYLQLKNLQLVNFEDIKRKNCLGLGNTAIRKESLPQNLNFNTDIAAVDWMLYSRMLFEKKTAIFTNDTYIYYRQYPNNSIGLKNITINRLIKGIKIKESHYQNLNQDLDCFNQELKEIINLKKYISNKDNLKNYFNKIVSLKLLNPQWWEEIKTLNEI
jgi:hypothetical protein